MGGLLKTSETKKTPKSKKTPRTGDNSTVDFHRALGRSLFVYSYEKKSIALKVFHQTNSVSETIRILGSQPEGSCIVGTMTKICHPKNANHYLVL